jgi:hypothetical protein
MLGNFKQYLETKSIHCSASARIAAGGTKSVE